MVAELNPFDQRFDGKQISVNGTSVERDGTWEGYDLELTRRVSDALSIPAFSPIQPRWNAACCSARSAWSRASIASISCSETVNAGTTRKVLLRGAFSKSPLSKASAAIAVASAVLVTLFAVLAWNASIQRVIMWWV